MSLGAFDIHFEKINPVHAGNSQHIVQRTHRYLDDFCPYGFVHQTADQRIVHGNIEIHGAGFIPGAFRHDNHSAIGDLLSKVPSDAFKVNRIGLHHNYFGRSTPQSIVAKRADVSADIHNYITPLDAAFRSKLGKPLLFSYYVPKQTLSARVRSTLLDPKRTGWRLK